MYSNNKKRGTHGFTLVELLVVMAIIAILASIVVPNVAKYITRSRMTNALSEVRNAETAFTGMLSDAQVGSFRDFFVRESGNVWDVLAGVDSLQRVYAAQDIYTQAFYELIRLGKNADPENRYGLNRTVTNKLGTSYMEIDKDPWGNLYNVYAGPWRGALEVPFRIKQPELGIPGGPKETGETIMTADGPVTTYYAPTDLPIYIWSNGQNLISGQRHYQNYTGIIDNVFTPQVENFSIVNGYREQDGEATGGGDDVNNWDSNQSWQEFYS